MAAIQEHSLTDNGFTKFFQSMPEKLDTTIRVFDRNDYFTAHGSDGLFVAKEVFGTISAVKYLGPEGNKVPWIVLSKLKFQSFARDLLLVKKYRLEIYCNKVKSANEWILTYKASPGNLQQLEDVVFSSNLQGDSSVVMAIRLITLNGQRVVGVAYGDSGSQELGVCQFIENDNFSNFESLLVQLGPKECLLVAKDTNTEVSIIRKILDKTNILVTERKKGDFSSKDIVQDLNRLLITENSSSLPQLELTQSMESLSAIIKYLELLSDERNFNRFKLSTFDINRYMRLDTAAAVALNVEPSPGETQSCSIVGVVNYCRTPQGQRLIRQWIKQPLIDLKLIVERQDLVQLLVETFTLRHTVQDKVLKLTPDYFRLAKRLQQGKATLQDCVSVYQSLQLLPVMIEGLTSYHGNHETLLNETFILPFTDLKDDFDKYQQMIETTLDLDMIQHHEFLIKPSFDVQLQELRDKMNSVEEKMNSIFRKTASELSLEMGKTLKLENNSQLGYYMRLSKKAEKSIRGQKRFIILDARNEGVRFTVGPLRSLSEQYNELQQSYNQTQDKFAKEVLDIARGYVAPILQLNDLTAHIDVLASLAQAATSGPLPYVRPVLYERGEGNIVLTGARHPCLELQDDVSFIANDVDLIRGEDEFQIITGPNMGGKSTYIRMVGSIVLLAQIGSYVPCTSAHISIVDAVLARVGAGDSQMRGVSTFMSEMLETATIIKTATKDSLIIIDELGRGTSTYDGFGLAWAISQYISTNIGCFCLFATHFHELTSLADQVVTVSNRHVTAITSDDNLTLLYRVKKGVSDQSFGIHVAEMAHFPHEVITFAKQKAKELELFYNQNNTSTGEGSMDEPSAKRQRTEIKEGEEVIDSYLKQLHQVCLETTSDEELELIMNRMKSEIMSGSNEYLKSIIST